MDDEKTNIYDQTTARHIENCTGLLFFYHIL